MFSMSLSFSPSCSLALPPLALSLSLASAAHASSAVSSSPAAVAAASLSASAVSSPGGAFVATRVSRCPTPSASNVLFSSSRRYGSRARRSSRPRVHRPLPCDSAARLQARATPPTVVVAVATIHHAHDHSATCTARTICLSSPKLEPCSVACRARGGQGFTPVPLRWARCRRCRLSIRLRLRALLRSSLAGGVGSADREGSSSVTFVPSPAPIPYRSRALVRVRVACCACSRRLASGGPHPASPSSSHSRHLAVTSMSGPTRRRPGMPQCRPKRRASSFATSRRGTSGASIIDSLTRSPVHARSLAREPASASVVASALISLVSVWNAECVTMGASM